MAYYVFYLVFVGISSANLGPMERNDNLKHTQAEFIAEWQWESWPIKQEKKEEDNPMPVLWSDPHNSGAYWHLFAASRSKNTQTFLWRFSASDRSWSKLYPVDDDDHSSGKQETIYYNPVQLPIVETRQAVTCVIPVSKNDTEEDTVVKEKIFSIWRKPKDKSQEIEKENNKILFIFEPVSLNILELDVKNKTINTTNCGFEKTNSTNNKKHKKKNINNRKNEINKDIIDIKLEEVKEYKYKNNKINETKQLNKTDKYKNNGINETKQLNNTDKYKNNGMNETEQLNKTNEFKINRINDTKRLNKTNGYKNKNKKDKIKIEKFKNVTYDNISDLSETLFLRQVKENENKKSCPRFNKNSEIISWCDGNTDAIFTADLNQIPLSLWEYDLRSRNWSEKAVNGNLWSECLPNTEIRHTGVGNDVFIFCTSNDQSDITTYNMTFNETSRNIGEKTIVLKLNAESVILEKIGDIAFNNENWKNVSNSVLKLINSDKNLILVLAYEDEIDLWLYHDNKFKTVANVFRGSAKKWFKNFNSTFYNLNFKLDKTSFQALISNPRKLNQYWSKESGRFIIRILNNENLNKPPETVGNTETIDDHLTYSLLKSDYVKNGSSDILNSNLKVLLFFGFSIVIFSLLGVILFIKTCVKCPRNLNLQNEEKSPQIVRYSVVPDDYLISPT